MPLTIQRMRGVAGALEYISPQRQSASGGYEDAGGQFDDEPAITCELWPGDDLPVAATLPASWLVNDAEARVAVVEFPVETMATLELGWYNAIITVVDTGQPIVAFRLEMTPGPGTGVRRPAYHAYKDLLDEAPWVRRLADEAYDQIGFAEASAEARDWLDAAILDAVRESLQQRRLPRSSSYSSSCSRDPAASTEYAEYAAALAADALVLDTPVGRRLFKATVYKALSIVLGRAVGMSNPPVDLLDKAKEYDAKAEASLKSCRSAEITGLDYVPLSLMSVGRITR